MEESDKSFRGNASQFFVAGELCRRGLVAVVTMGNCPNTDILCSNIAGTRFAHIQVKTFVPGRRTCALGVKAEKEYGEKFFWVLGGIPTPDSGSDFEYYVIPSATMAQNIRECHRLWLEAPGKDGQPHNDSKVRTVHLPPCTNRNGWSIAEYRDRWDLIQDCVVTPH